MINLKEQIENYIPFDEQEEADKQSMLELLKFENALSRDNIFAHFSASAFVVTEDFKQALVVNHNILGGLIYPGGHADGEADLFSVALREVEEETGIKVAPVLGKEIFAIHAAPIAGHVKRGKFVSSHIHYDVVYLMKANSRDKDKIRKAEAENSEVKWIDLDETYGDKCVASLRFAQKKIVEKLKKLGLAQDN